jgi:hypothetical protein
MSYLSEIDLMSYLSEIDLMSYLSEIDLMSYLSEIGLIKKRAVDYCCDRSIFVSCSMISFRVGNRDALITLMINGSDSSN